MKQIEQPMQMALALSAFNTRLVKQLEIGLSVHGISFSELLVLHRLHIAPQKTMRRIDLAQGVGLTASGVTRLLKPMEKIGLIDKETNSRDARVSLVKLTPAGERIYEEAFTTCESQAASATDVLTSRQADSLLKLLNTLNRGVLL